MIDDDGDFLRVLSEGESSSVEFKRCGDLPHADTFETVCSFANRLGGSIYLGVADDGDVIGVDADRAVEIERNVANVAANRKLFVPAPMVETERFAWHGRMVIRIGVMPSSSVVRFKGVVYDRVADADIRLNSDIQISQMYIRKQNYYSERRIFRYVTPFDLRADRIATMRRMAVAQRPGHPWGTMTDEELFRSAKLYDRDYSTGEEGFTLAAVLLLGRDDVIASVCPSYVTDAIVRRDDVDHYDDRLMVKTNLFDAYRQLVDFTQRGLPDRFALDEGRRTSPRDVIVREMVANSLMHREYSSPIVAQIVMDNDAIRTVNASRSFFEGRMRLGEFTPMPKNPIIADVFVQTGLAEKLGSGLRNLVKASRLYTGRDPEFADGDLFTAMVPTSGSSPAEDSHGVPADEERSGMQRPRRRSVREELLHDTLTAMLENHRFATVPQIAGRSGVDVRAVRKYLNQLVDDGELVAEGRTRGRRYRMR